MALEMSEVFWTFFITSVIGFVLALGKLCYKSKCSEINFCCLRVVRNIDVELKEDIELGASSKDNDNDNKK